MVVVVVVDADVVVFVVVVVVGGVVVVGVGVVTTITIILCPGPLAFGAAVLSLSTYRGTGQLSVRVAFSGRPARCVVS